MQTKLAVNQEQILKLLERAVPMSMWAMVAVFGVLAVIVIPANAPRRLLNGAFWAGLGWFCMFGVFELIDHAASQPGFFQSIQRVLQSSEGFPRLMLMALLLLGAISTLMKIADGSSSIGQRARTLSEPTAAGALRFDRRGLR